MSAFENINSEMYLNIKLVNTDSLKVLFKVLQLLWSEIEKVNIFPLFSLSYFKFIIYNAFKLYIADFFFCFFNKIYVNSNHYTNKI